MGQGGIGAELDGAMVQKTQVSLRRRDEKGALAHLQHTALILLLQDQEHSSQLRTTN